MSRSETPRPAPPRILLLMSGSIACAKASSLISEWSKRGCEVRVACTRSVASFVGRSTLEGLGAEQVFDDVFESGRAMEHISLGKWADIVIAAPATSNLINKFAAGLADDAVSTLWQAAYGQGKPMLVAPAMNTRMWRYPATRESVSRLGEWGVKVLPVGTGELACGEQGEGRMLEPEVILRVVEELLAARHGDGGRRILLTAGGTREPIDSVRYIGNLSSGRTAARLADALGAAGHRVTWLGAEDALQPELAARRLRFSTFDGLAKQLQTLLAADDYDAVIHAAAVSDFRVDAVLTAENVPLAAPSGKLPSDADLVLRLKRNPKLLDRIRGWSRNAQVTVIGFKLTDTGDPQEQLAAVRKQFEESQVDAVVHNDLGDISQDSHAFTLHAPGREPLACADGGALARAIDRLLGELP